MAGWMTCHNALVTHSNVCTCTRGEHIVSTLSTNSDGFRNAFRFVSPEPGVLCIIGYPSETHIKLKSREISFVLNIRLDKQIVLIFCTEHGSIIAVLCAKFQYDWKTDKCLWTNEVLRDFSLRWVSDGYCTAPLRPLSRIFPWIDITTKNNNSIHQLPSAEDIPLI